MIRLHRDDAERIAAALGAQNPETLTDPALQALLGNLAAGLPAVETYPVRSGR